MRMNSKSGPWGIVTTDIRYNDTKIEDFHCESNGDSKVLYCTIDLIEDFHIFERIFRIFIKYVYNDDLVKTYETEYFIDVINF